MGIFRRINDIISANINDLVDRFEDPEVMLKQAVREMEAAISAAMNSAAKVIANERLLTRQLEHYRWQVDFWQKRAQEAVHRGNDDAAREALARKRENQTLQAALEDQLAETTRASQTLRRQIDAMRVRLAEARRKQALMTARQQAALARKQLAANLHGIPRDQTAFSRFDDWYQQMESTEAEADALIELIEGAGLSHTGDPEIETELQALKQSLQGTENHPQPDH